MYYFISKVREKNSFVFFEKSVYCRNDYTRPRWLKLSGNTVFAKNSNLPRKKTCLGHDFFFDTFFFSGIDQNFFRGIPPYRGVFWAGNGSYGWKLVKKPHSLGGYPLKIRFWHMRFLKKNVSRDTFFFRPSHPENRVFRGVPRGGGNEEL